MDGSEDDSYARGRFLLSQLDLIFASDPLIDELGFVHPSQLSSMHSSDDSTAGDLPFLKTDAQMSLGPTGSSTGEEESHARADCSPKTEHGVNVMDDQGTSLKEESDDGLPYDKTAFWCGDHKLAISLSALGPMYKCAKASFASTRINYKNLLLTEQGIGLTKNGETFGASKTMEVNVDHTDGAKLKILATERVGLEDSLMSYSRALVLINCDHASAWNTRKKIILTREPNQGVLTAELHMAGIVLSCGPKSEEAWAYRRWVINHMIRGGISREKLDSLLEGESKLVEAVAGRSLMNYRAWRHRCWLVSQMSFLQVAIELHRTKLWAASHVADNCCFHYRRCLLLQLIKSKVPESDQVSSCMFTAVEKEVDMKSLKVALLDGPEIRVLWKEEMIWIKSLIQCYIGREALWIHLRFLFFSWVCHVGPVLESPYWASLSAVCERAFSDTKESLLSIGSEQHFVDCCISACSSDFTEDGDRQREFAATYKLWVLMMGSRQQKERGKNGSQETYEDDFSTLEHLLQEGVPHQKRLWEGLLPNLLQARTDPSYSHSLKNTRHDVAAVSI